MKPQRRGPRPAISGELRGQDGFTLVEILIVLMLAAIIFTAVTGVMMAALRQTTGDGKRNDVQDNIRAAIDMMTRYARNITAPSSGVAGALEKAGPYDMVFQAVGSGTPFGGANASNQLRVRFCLDASVPTNESLWMQTQTWTTASAPAAPDTSGCPSSAWSTQYQLVANVTNQIYAQNRPLFNYAPLGATSTGVINGVIVDLFINQTPGNDPGEIESRTGVYLRNTNAPPTASFSVSTQNGSFLLNASASSDPNGQALAYQWLLNGSPITGATSQQYNAGTFPSGSSQTFGLQVTDSAGLTASATPQTVTAP